ncbi:MAG: MFS transporter [Pseudomonadota bacterium]
MFNSRRRFYYGWVIVAVCSMSMAIAYGIMYSFSVFFKPIVAEFNWDRATVSSIYSLAMVFRGVVTIPIGWLADRYGAMKIAVFCGVMMGSGLILASRVTELWQFYVAYGIIVSIGLSGAYTIGSAVTSRWFERKRGLALGLVAAGAGFGTLALVPFAQYLISAFNWSTAFIIIGAGAGFFTIATAFLLKPAPKPMEHPKEAAATSCRVPLSDVSLRSAILSREMLILVVTFSLINFCIQMIMIHLVNYATDIGISSFQAAGFLGIIGVVSIVGRLFMGGVSDRIGTYNSLIVCSILLLVSLIVLFFNISPWGFYVFAVLFGFSYGGEIPQLPMFIAQIFGIRAMAALMGVVVFIGTIGGALGPWVGGKIFDSTQNYHYAFAIAGAASLIRLSLVIGCKKYLIPRSRGNAR